MNKFVFIIIFTVFLVGIVCASDVTTDSTYDSFLEATILKLKIGHWVNNNHGGNCYGQLQFILYKYDNGSLYYPQLGIALMAGSSYVYPDNVLLKADSIRVGSIGIKEIQGPDYDEGYESSSWSVGILLYWDEKLAMFMTKSQTWIIRIEGRDHTTVDFKVDRSDLMAASKFFQAHGLLVDKQQSTTNTGSR